ncbi:hypothetical protein Tco_0097864 [Tanacetum coccineum]
MVHQLTKFHVQRVDMVINPPWNLPFLGAKGLTSPEQTATVEPKGGTCTYWRGVVCQRGSGQDGRRRATWGPLIGRGRFGWLWDRAGLFSQAHTLNLLKSLGGFSDAHNI